MQTKTNRETYEECFPHKRYTIRKRLTPSGEINSDLNDLRDRTLKAFMKLKNNLGMAFNQDILTTFTLIDAMIKPIITQIFCLTRRLMRMPQHFLNSPAVVYPNEPRSAPVCSLLPRPVFYGESLYIRNWNIGIFLSSSILYITLHD